MESSIFTGGRTQESVAYDLALAIAAKDPEISTPEVLIQRIAEILPACRSAAEKRWEKENPPLDNVIFDPFTY